ncbi:MAG TPA: hypothetical protein VF804_04455 [Holophagaceae bacterium]
MRLRRALLAPVLVLLGACRPPAHPEPDRQASLEEAARSAAAPLPPAQRADFIEGFRMGAHMVWEASAQRRLPWLPRMGEPAPAPLPEAARAMGAVAEEPGPRVELDPGTGFPIRFLDPAAGPFGPGEVAGFDWALPPVRERLCRPRTVPAFPAGEAWQAWQPSGTLLSAPGRQVRVRHLGSTLLWTWAGNGFPPQRRWRPAPAWLAPVSLALAPGVLWIATEAHGAVALDLETGLVIGVADRYPPSTHPGDQDEQAAERDQAAEDLRERPLRLARAAKGDARAMVELAWAATDPREQADWLRKAAEAGSVDGMYELGVRLYQGRGVPKDPEGARAWFQRAARAGDARAAEVLQGLFRQP